MGTKVVAKTPETVRKAVYTCYQVHTATCGGCPLAPWSHVCMEWLSDKLASVVADRLGAAPEKGELRDKYARDAADIAVEYHFDPLYLDLLKVKESIKLERSDKDD